MKYFVTVAGEEIEVEVDGDQVTVGGEPHTTALSSVAGTPMRQLLVDGRPVVVAMHGEGHGRWMVALRGERWEVDVVDERTRHIRSLAGQRSEHRGGGVLRAPMPGLVARIPVTSGQSVDAGTSLVVLEAMKMENELRAPAAAVVKAILVEPGQAVEKGQPLVEFGEPEA